MANETTNYQCPACTGPLHFGSESGVLECDYCGSAYTVAEIEAREGWAEVAAVKNHEVYLIGANVTSQPCQNIVDALVEIAADVYPEVYGELIAK